MTGPDVQRWKVPPGYVDYHGAGPTDRYVEVVLYADHVAAVAAAEQRERERILNDWSLGQMQGNSNGEWILNVVRQKNFERGVKAARDAVAALPSALNCWDRYGFHIEKNDALATIDALQTSLSGPAVLLSSEPEPPTSVAPAGEEHGAPAEPPCPFPMGSKVRRSSGKWPGEVGIVDGWEFRSQPHGGAPSEWRVWVTWRDNQRRHASPEYLELVPEPPAGTPVWWDGKWWIRDEESAPYAPTLWGERDLTKFWEFMPGAVPAATPGGDDE